MITGEKTQATANIVIGVGGVTIGLQDITNIAQAIAAVGGAILVVYQCWRTFRKK